MKYSKSCHPLYSKKWADMNIEQLANSGALQIKLYVPGKSKKEVERELKLTKTVKMASNENPFSASEQAKEAIIAALDEIHMYPNPTSLELREALAGIQAVSKDEITVGNGADGVIYNLGMAVINQVDEVLIPKITFPVYETITRVMRGRPIFTRMRDLRIDLEDIIRHIGEKTKAIFLCNPNNPTGDILSKDEILAFLKETPPSMFPSSRRVRVWLPCPIRNLLRER